MDWARARFQVAIISDTFYEFGMPFMAKLGWPTLLCHKLVVEDDQITGYTDPAAGPQALLGARIPLPGVQDSRRR